jgi:MFS family permease
MHPVIANRRILTAALVGTSVEFYDFYIYATAASLVFGAQFFSPDLSSTHQLLLSYATFGLAFVARPVGAAVFGHFGDRIGRKSTLVASLMLMGASTVLVAFLPTYAQIGVWAPVLLCVLRFGQGFGLGGEWGGAALLAVENAPPGWRARFGTAPQMGAPIGFIAANGLFLILGVALTPQQFADWGWRLPFLLSAVLVGLGLWVRLKISETPAFQRVLKEGPPPSVPLAEMAWSHGGAVVRGTLAVVACFAIFYISTAFALGYGTTKLHHSQQAFLGAQLIAILFMAAGILIAGWWSDRTSPRSVLIWGCLGVVLTGAVLAPLLTGPLFPAAVFLSLALFVMGFVYGPVGAWLPAQFPARVRYTGASIAFNVGGVIGGALTPFAAQALSERGLVWVGVYLAAAGLLSAIGLIASRPTTN